MRFFSRQITKNQIVFSEDESKHIIKTYRLKSGDRIQAIDGSGHLYHAEISSWDKKNCYANITQREYHERRSKYLHIAMAPTKNMNRFEWFLEKSCEIGIEKITPLITERSERKIIKNYDRLDKIIIGAMKQSGMLHKPVLEQALTFDDLMNTPEIPEGRFICHCNSEEMISIKEVDASKPTIILIGPEGDFSPKETTQAKKQSFKSLNLGKNILRTETAGIVVSSVFENL